MQVIKGDYHNLQAHSSLALAIGNFDGIHLGHQQVIKACHDNENISDLNTNWIVFVDTEVVNKHFSFKSDCSKDCGRVGSPCHITHLHGAKLFDATRNENYFT